MFSINSNLWFFFAKNLNFDAHFRTHTKRELQSEPKKTNPTQESKVTIFYFYWEKSLILFRLSVDFDSGDGLKHFREFSSIELVFEGVDAGHQFDEGPLQRFDGHARSRLDQAVLDLGQLFLVDLERCDDGWSVRLNVLNKVEIKKMKTKDLKLLNKNILTLDEHTIYWLSLK